MHRLRTLVILAVCLCAAGAAMPVARATPSNTKISKVFRLPCVDDVCDARDHAIANSAAVSGSIQIQVSSSSSVGLDWARLDARRDGGTWTCMKEWDLDSSSFSSRLDWKTTKWPGACPDGLDVDTRNGVYELRLVAKEKVTGDQQISPLFTVDVANRPAVPSWASGELSVTGAAAREPRVTLRFSANPEPDTLEYHYIRVSPGGGEDEWAVSAAKPGGQGCDQEGATYVCEDDVFPQFGFGGTYTYALVAYRATPAGSDTCALPPEPKCVQSSLSDSRSITINEPAAPKPSKTGSGGTVSTPGTGSGSPAGGSRSRGGSPGPGGGATYCDFYCGEYEKKLPYNGDPFAVAPGNAASDSRLKAATLPLDQRADPSSMWRSIAGGLLLLLAAAHAARVLRHA